MRSAPETIEHFLDHMGETYGGAAAYLARFGFSPEKAKRLTALLVE